MNNKFKRGLALFAVITLAGTLMPQAIQTILFTMSFLANIKLSRAFLNAMMTTSIHTKILQPL
jgi:hypothetical protein